MVAPGAGARGGWVGGKAPPVLSGEPGRAKIVTRMRDGSAGPVPAWEGSAPSESSGFRVGAVRVIRMQVSVVRVIQHPSRRRPSHSSSESASSSMKAMGSSTRDTCPGTRAHVHTHTASQSAHWPAWHTAQPVSAPRPPNPRLPPPSRSTFHIPPPVPHNLTTTHTHDT